MRKRLIAVCLCALLMVTLPFTVFAEEQERTHIRYSYWGTGDEARSTQAAIDAYNASQDAVYVELMLIPNATYTQELQRRSALSTRMTDADMPDCGIMHESGVLDFASNGLLADVTDMYPAEDRPMACVTYRQGERAVAYSSSTGTLILYYNKDLLDAAGLPYPPQRAEDAWTWEEFVTVAKKLTADSAGRHPGDAAFDAATTVQYGCCIDRWAWQMEVWAHSNGGRWFSEDGKQSLIASEESVEAIQRIADLTLLEHVQPTAEGLGDHELQRLFLDGNIAMMTGGTWNIGTCLESSGINYGIAVLPRMDKAVTLATSGPQVVFSRSRQQEAAMDFIRWYMNRDNCWPLIQSGIWMPLFEKYYTDDACIDKWLRDPEFVLADQYDAARSVLVDYTRDHAIPAGWYYTPRTDRYFSLLQEALAPVWTGEQTAREAIDGVKDRLADAIKQDF